MLLFKLIETHLSVLAQDLVAFGVDLKLLATKSQVRIDEEVGLGAHRNSVVLMREGMNDVFFGVVRKDLVDVLVLEFLGEKTVGSSIVWGVHVLLGGCESNLCTFMIF